MWQSESFRHGIPQRSTVKRNDFYQLTRKQIVPLLFPSFRDAMLSLKDCRVGRLRPPRNDKIESFYFFLPAV